MFKKVMNSLLFQYVVFFSSCRSYTFYKLQNLVLPVSQKKQNRKDIKLKSFNLLTNTLSIKRGKNKTVNTSGNREVIFGLILSYQANTKTCMID